ncbi:hypothetical protein M011DRAFT_293232 [Sporormia fimetaria CBS 119925]|uniref:Uncharacterized protein n=1 Tax=Sporormia fimetaria CBS 119925 TaxID=1340428 RepID=A0A6A6UVB5_9PLEO|nr:hypothetical protein M011DRAFT_293232 [Sporormia fimetaria CBS 119925]
MSLSPLCPPVQLPSSIPAARIRPLRERLISSGYSLMTTRPLLPFHAHSTPWDRRDSPWPSIRPSRRPCGSLRCSLHFAMGDRVGGPGASSVLPAWLRGRRREDAASNNEDGGLTRRIPDGGYSRRIMHSGPHVLDRSLGAGHPALPSNGSPALEALEDSRSGNAFFSRRAWAAFRNTLHEPHEMVARHNTPTIFTRSARPLARSMGLPDLVCSYPGTNIYEAHNNIRSLGPSVNHSWLLSFIFSDPPSWVLASNPLLHRLFNLEVHLEPIHHGSTQARQEVR